MLAAAAIPAAAQDLTGAGATFPYPIYSKWFSDYAAKTGVKINYQSIGSGGGIRQLSEQTVDFGASDAPMSDAELAKAKGGAIMHIPTVLGAVVVTYNVPELKRPLRLDGTTLADIFLGKITTWNDARIAALNPGATLPATDILVVHRSDGIGHELRLHRLPVERERRLGSEAGQGEGSAVAGRTRRQGQRGRGRSGEAAAGLDRLRRAGVRQAEQARLRGHPERAGRSS